VTTGRPWRWVALAAAAPVVLGGAFVIGQSMQPDDRPATAIVDAGEADDFEWEYVIPVGTADRIAAGEPVEIVPAALTVTVGESIRIVNEDDIDHVVGVFFVRAGAEVTQRFASAGQFTNDCSVHSSGSFTLTIVE
jgi:plastocyanin